MDMDFQGKTLSDLVFTKISSEIINGTTKKGDKLLSENQLCELYKVSRVSVRSAINKLQAQGFVYTKPGKGTYVLSDNIGASMMRNMTRTLDMSHQEYIEIMELRQTIEYKSIELIVERGTKDDFEQLNDALESMKLSRLDYKKYAEADLQFHLTIIKGSHNRFFYDIINSCHDALAKYFTEMCKVNFDEFEVSIKKHQKILTELKNGNVKLAQTTMLRIIEANIKSNIDYLRE
ncbi:MAG TPA: FadR/GntR family transcriptional regulator [Ruminiclostridium sp.]